MRTLPIWIEALIVTILIVAGVCLAIYLAAAAINSIIDAKARLEELRTRSEIEAVNKWQELYEEERDARRADNAALIERIGELLEQNGELEKQVERRDALMKKVKVAEL